MSTVRLVGVGPGHPGLATVQAVEAIKDADVIRNCDGCGTGLLHLAPAHADIAPLESVDEVIKLARNGKKITVLFPGNPYAFSNGSAIAACLELVGVGHHRPAPERALAGKAGGADPESRSARAAPGHCSAWRAGAQGGDLRAPRRRAPRARPRRGHGRTA